MADILWKQYQDVFSVPKDLSIYSNSEPSVQSSLSDIDFTVQDIIGAIDELSNNSASDGVRFVLLKQWKDQQSKALYNLWINCLEIGVTPEDLRTAHIIPIFKSGHQGLAVNYRPIALTFHMIKIFEKKIPKQYSNIHGPAMILNMVLDRGSPASAN